MDNKTNKKIDRSLMESARAIDELKQKLKEEEAQLPKTALKMEDRLQDLQQELDSISDKMLAYKLRRIADSKMLAAVAKLSQDDSATVASSGKSKPEGDNAVSPDVDKNLSSGAINQGKQLKRKAPTRAGKSNNKQNTNYQSSTFQCKSDLDQCLITATHPIEKALCYALFIRCAIKG